MVAFNQVGDAPATRHTAATVPIPPAPIAALVVTLNVGSRDVPLQWLASATGGRPDAYHLQYRLRTATEWPDTFATVTGTTHTLTGLELATAYDLRLRAANAAGVSNWVTTAFTTASSPQPQPTSMRTHPEEWPEAA